MTMGINARQGTDTGFPSIRRNQQLRPPTLPRRVHGGYARCIRGKACNPSLFHPLNQGVGIDSILQNPAPDGIIHNIPKGLQVMQGIIKRTPPPIADDLNPANEACARGHGIPNPKLFQKRHRPAVDGRGAAISGQQIIKTAFFKNNTPRPHRRQGQRTQRPRQTAPNNKSIDHMSIVHAPIMRGNRTARKILYRPAKRIMPATPAPSHPLA